MRIAILTQPLWTNYGGILQAYALQTILQRRGHRVEVINREQNDYPSIRLFVLRLCSVVKCCVRVFFFRQREYVIMSPMSAFYHIKWRGYDVLPFVYDNINLSPQLRNSKRLNRYFSKRTFDYVIVGSDQVWRPSYSPCITDYFLKELSMDSPVKRIAYAASFGTDCWEFSRNDTEECAALVQKFDAVSVRESSGVRLCDEYLGVKATHLLDPTMLLSIDDYLQIIKKSNVKKKTVGVFCYLLDKNAEVERAIEYISKAGYDITYATIEVYATPENPHPVQMSVEQWLRCVYDAELILTDSFHACVFSIIFKKPFIVWNNSGRGNARLDSLLTTFGLQERMVNSYSEFERRKENLFMRVDSDNVMEILQKWREKSFNFLTSVGL